MMARVADGPLGEGEQPRSSDQPRSAPSVPECWRGHDHREQHALDALTAGALVRTARIHHAPAAGRMAISVNQIFQMSQKEIDLFFILHEHLTNVNSNTTQAHRSKNHDN